MATDQERRRRRYNTGPRISMMGSLGQRRQPQQQNQQQQSTAPPMPRPNQQGQQQQQQTAPPMPMDRMDALRQLGTQRIANRTLRRDQQQQAREQSQHQMMQLAGQARDARAAGQDASGFRDQLRQHQEAIARGTTRGQLQADRQMRQMGLDQQRAAMNAPPPPLLLNEGQAAFDARTGETFATNRPVAPPITLDQGQRVFSSGGDPLASNPASAPPLTLSEGEIAFNPETNQEIARGIAPPMPKPELMRDRFEFIPGVEGQEEVAPSAWYAPWTWGNEDGQEHIESTPDMVMDTTTGQMRPVNSQQNPTRQMQLPEGVTMEDVEFTAEQEGITVEEVLRRLNGGM